MTEKQLTLIYDDDTEEGTITYSNGDTYPITGLLDEVGDHTTDLDDTRFVVFQYPDKQFGLQPVVMGGEPARMLN